MTQEQTINKELNLNANKTLLESTSKGQGIAEVDAFNALMGKVIEDATTVSVQEALCCGAAAISAVLAKLASQKSTYDYVRDKLNTAESEAAQLHAMLTALNVPSEAGSEHNLFSTYPLKLTLPVRFALLFAGATNVAVKQEADSDDAAN